mmetsp:Transcript_13108/g.20364  ORF Transcript_13108/g.20364 Transcript_13108/m.20364 type:complete len:382 (+) Transcript_13108:78-1223(+)
MATNNSIELQPQPKTVKFADDLSRGISEEAICSVESSDENVIPLWRIEEKEKEGEEALTKVKSVGISFCDLMQCVFTVAIGFCTVVLIVYLGGGLSGTSNKASDPPPVEGSPTESPTPSQSRIISAVPTIMSTTTPIPTIINPIPKLTSPSSIAVYNMLREYMDDELRVTHLWTAQGKAFQDLVSAEELAPTQQSYRVVQRYALLTLYYSTSPESWDYNSGYDDSVFTNECLFFGVEICRRTTRGVEVIKLDLSDNSLKGTIPEELCLLNDSLEHIILSSNNLEGSIPSCIADFKNLKKLDLHNNLLNGTLPEGLMFSPSLLEVDLSNNELEGGLDIIFEGGDSEQPLALGLMSFNVGSNKFTGTIPTKFDSMSKFLKIVV